MSSPGQRFIREYAVAHERSQPDCVARRTRVLAHPDLAAQLTKPPLALTDPANWNGWIPPKKLPEDTCPQCAHPPKEKRGEYDYTPPLCDGWDHTGRANDSPTRTQLVNIAAEALRREREQEQAHPSGNGSVEREAARAELASRQPAPMPELTAPTTTEET